LAVDNTLSKYGTTFPRGFEEGRVHFPMERAGELVSLNYGKSLVERTRSPGSVPVYGTNGRCGWNGQALREGPTVVLGRKGMGPLGVEWCNGPFWVIDTAYYVTKNRPDLDLKFFYYLIKYIGLNHLKDGTSNPSLSRDTFSSQLLPLPTNREQQQIAGILGSLDDKIDLNRRMNETLEAMARAIFKSWFVDFDPVRAKMEGRQPVGIDAETAHLFPESFEESLLGLIPSGWRPCSWGDVITLEYGKSLRGYEKVQGDYTVFGTNGAIGRNDEALCQHPGIIVGRKGAYRGVHFHDEPFFVIDTAYYVEPKKPLELRWAYYQMLREDINGMDSGSAIPSTSRDQFYKVGLTYPPFPIQRRFVELLSPLWFRQRLSSQESFTLSAVRDVLLPKLLSGEIRVEHAERMIEGGM